MYSEILMYTILLHLYQTELHLHDSDYHHSMQRRTAKV